MIYCVEDDRNIRELILYTLKTTGFEACGFCNGKEMFSKLTDETPDLILLDIMLPGEDGICILKKIKSQKATRDIPVIMVTAKGEEYDKVIGLDSGADDYITKPFGMMEFISRVKALLRRSIPEGKKKEEDVLSIGDLTLNTKSYIVTSQGQEVSLTRKEFELLRLLIINRDIVLTRDMLLGEIWGYDFDGETRTVDVHIRTLRSKLGEPGNYIETVRGVGYRMKAPKE